METMGERLARLRNLKGLSQAKLAAMAGFSGQGAIGNIERGSRGYGASIVDIARALDTTPEYLRMESDDATGPMRPGGDAPTAAPQPPTLQESLEVVAAALSSVPPEKRQALLGVLATYSSDPTHEANSLAYLRSELAKTTGRQTIDPASIATGQPPGGAT